MRHGHLIDHQRHGDKPQVKDAGLGDRLDLCGPKENERAGKIILPPKMTSATSLVLARRRAGEDHIVAFTQVTGIGEDDPDADTQRKEDLSRGLQPDAGG